MTASKASKNKSTGQKKPAPPNPPDQSESELSEEALEGVAGGMNACVKGEHFKKVIIIT